MVGLWLNQYCGQIRSLSLDHSKENVSKFIGYCALLRIKGAQYKIFNIISHDWKVAWGESFSENVFSSSSEVIYFEKNLGRGKVGKPRMRGNSLSLMSRSQCFSTVCVLSFSTVCVLIFLHCVCFCFRLQTFTRYSGHLALRLVVP